MLIIAASRTCKVLAIWVLLRPGGQQCHMIQTVWCRNTHLRAHVHVVPGLSSKPHGVQLVASTWLQPNITPCTQMCSEHNHDLGTASVDSVGLPRQNATSGAHSCARPQPGLEVTATDLNGGPSRVQALPSAWRLVCCLVASLASPKSISLASAWPALVAVRSTLAVERSLKMILGSRPCRYLSALATCRDHLHQSKRPSQGWLPV